MIKSAGKKGEVSSRQTGDGRFEIVMDADEKAASQENRPVAAGSAPAGSTSRAPRAIPTRLVGGLAAAVLAVGAGVWVWASESSSSVEMPMSMEAVPGFKPYGGNDPAGPGPGGDRPVRPRALVNSPSVDPSNLAPDNLGNSPGPEGEQGGWQGGAQDDGYPNGTDPGTGLELRNDAVPVPVPMPMPGSPDPSVQPFDPNGARAVPSNEPFLDSPGPPPSPVPTTATGSAYDTLVPNGEEVPEEGEPQEEAY